MSYIRFVATSFVLISYLFLAACGRSERGENEIIVGTIAGPEAALVHVAAAVAKSKYNLDLKIVEFEDYVTPNTALAEGSIDANVFQHQPYLDLAVSNKRYNIQSIGKTFVYPMGVYSKNHMPQPTALLQNLLFSLLTEELLIFIRASSYIDI